MVWLQTRKRKSLPSPGRTAVRLLSLSSTCAELFSDATGNYNRLLLVSASRLRTGADSAAGKQSREFLGRLEGKPITHSGRAKSSAAENTRKIRISDQEDENDVVEGDTEREAEELPELTDQVEQDRTGAERSRRHLQHEGLELVETGHSAIEAADHAETESNDNKEAEEAEDETSTSTSSKSRTTISTEESGSKLDNRKNSRKTKQNEAEQVSEEEDAESEKENAAEDADAEADATDEQEENAEAEGAEDGEKEDETDTASISSSRKPTPQDDKEGGEVSGIKKTGLLETERSVTSQDEKKKNSGEKGASASTEDENMAEEEEAGEKEVAEVDDVSNSPDEKKVVKKEDSNKPGDGAQASAAEKSKKEEKTTNAEADTEPAPALANKATKQTTHSDATGDQKAVSGDHEKKEGGTSTKSKQSEGLALAAKLREEQAEHQKRAAAGAVTTVTETTTEDPITATISVKYQELAFKSCAAEDLTTSTLEGDLGPNYPHKDMDLFYACSEICKKDIFCGGFLWEDLSGEYLCKLKKSFFGPQPIWAMCGPSSYVTTYVKVVTWTMQGDRKAMYFFCVIIIMYFCASAVAVFLFLLDVVQVVVQHVHVRN
ncbi:unnamed protein product [Amoebophrya sp. A120]|nr:unnamed protein product [Amoebophrya sp. A120]|eukprot:GSA120T00011317001.1